MKNKYIVLLTLVILITQVTYAQQKKRTDANIIGHVVCAGEHIPFAGVSVKGTAIGTTTDITGHYRILDLPLGEVVIRVEALGYLPQEKRVSIIKNVTKEIKFELVQDLLGIEEVVITGDRNEVSRREASTVVSRITPKMFEETQSITLSDGLSFTPGLKLETNCQNCGFTQIRMNGLEGPYSQILINSRPIFSGLAGVYGLEIIPVSMIERVEVIRGGGSALYGSNAIAGTINLILKDPVNNSFEFGLNSAIIGLGIKGSGKPASEYSVNFNSSLVSTDGKTGMALYGFHRLRNAFDANNDSFTELPTLKNITIGSRLYHRFGNQGRLIGDFFHINEVRRGGDKLNSLVHEAGIAEAVKHDLTTAAISYDQFVRDEDKLEIFASGQKIDRDSYYGANQRLNDYGNTNDFTYDVGIQYNAKFNMSNLIIGLEDSGELLNDTKLGYPDYNNAVIINDSIVSIPHTENVLIANQITNTLGAFSQYDIKWEKLKVSIGGRFDNYRVEDKESENGLKTGNVFSPRLNFLYDVKDYLQARMSFSQGYRAPQIFDEDLHIETSGSRKVIHDNAPDLVQETSNSFMASLDFNKRIKELPIGILIEAFYTKLNNPFVNEYNVPDSSGTVVYTRINAENGAIVTGVNMELNIVPNSDFSLKSGFTYQECSYDKSQEFNEKSFLRTPNDYGYITVNWNFVKNFSLSSTANYTGKMLVPYFGTQIENPEQGELRTSKEFYDLGLKITYDLDINDVELKIFVGVKNILNSYQTDFDYGIDRDPGYVYGPTNPRMISFGIKVGSF